MRFLQNTTVAIGTNEMIASFALEAEEREREKERGPLGKMKNMVVKILGEILEKLHLLHRKVFSLVFL